ncbi:hypothetical protein QMO56_20375 [Roseomonas sp. E05]|uniref:hypothetical protein n=1 Tax=Roseomonas sp. E05 TaxID=3046310 RepID=UPI0024B8E38E|nr:hypothetical protein [Roseomonas sp. E05]MDJ0390474.1 hypothetical protein [Roseomonas sp. E05]
MTDPSFAARLRARNLQRIPEADQADLARLVQALDEAAARIRGPIGYLEEPSNVFRLAPAAKEAAR